MLGASMAAATSDTWSSELGIYFKGKTFDLFKMRSISVGVSGGMSKEGTFAGFIGATAIALICNFIYFGKLNPKYLLVVTFFGFSGMILDSLMGSLFQIKYSKNGVFYDAPIRDFEAQSGIKWMTNDTVNLFSNGIITLASGLFYWMLS